MFFYFLKKAIEKSKESVKKGGYPVGAVIVRNKEIISYGFSDGKNLKDATSHAEIDAIRKASKKLLTFTIRLIDKNCMFVSDAPPWSSKNSQMY